MTKDKLDLPLTSQELYKLERFLSKPPTSTALNLTAAHGFLSSTLSAPHKVKRKQWQAILLGGHPTRSLKQTVRPRPWLNRLAAQITTDLTAHCLTPLIVEEGQTVPYQKTTLNQLGQWCDGYLIGAMQDELWCTDEAAQRLLIPFGGWAALVYQTESELIYSSVLKKVADSQDLAQVRDELLLFIRTFYEYWASYRRMYEVSSTQDNAGTRSSTGSSTP